MRRIQPGDPIEARDAYSMWLTGVADSGVEPTHDGHRKIHDFPVIWVRFEGCDRIPWPAKDVRSLACVDFTKLVK